MVYKYKKEDNQSKYNSNSSKVELHRTEQSNPSNTLRTVFAKQSNEQIEYNKQLARQSIIHIPEPHISDDYYANNTIDIPQRPPWSSTTTPEQLDKNETKLFSDWLNNIYDRYRAEQLNHFEHNIEVWRQLWRVCERSNILIIIADSRNPLFNLPPSLYHYITDIIKKPMILVLNKIDYLPQQCIDEWIDYFRMQYPKLHVIPYTSKPNEIYRDTISRFKQIHKQKAGGALKLDKPVGADLLLQSLRDVVKQYKNDTNNISLLSNDTIEQFSFDTTYLDSKLGSLDTNNQSESDPTDRTSDGIAILGPASRKARVHDGDSDNDTQTRTNKKHGKKKNKSYNKARHQSLKNDRDDSDSNNDDNVTDDMAQRNTSNPKNHHKTDDIDSDDNNDIGDVSTVVHNITNDDIQSNNTNYISLGFIGYPNSGKSSVINSLCGRKLVSVSSTPGHTKYLQSIFLNQYTCLLDSPGLVFPCINMSRAIQVLAGCYPIAQTRDPYTAVHYLAQRVDLVELYKLQQLRDEHDYDDFSWSAWTICESFSSKKGYRNRKGILDVYRGANEILRDQLQGKVLLYYWPPTHQTSK